jgi:hypothetical protein
VPDGDDVRTELVHSLVEERIPGGACGVFQ